MARHVRARLGTEDFARLAAFRHALRRFLRFSHAAAGRVGLTGQHYQALLAIRGGSESQQMTVAELAQHLLTKHNSAVGLVDRLAARGLVTRDRVPGDRRKVRVRLTPKGERVLERLALIHREELRTFGPVMRALLENLFGPSALRGPVSGRRRRGPRSGGPAPRRPPTQAVVPT